LDQQQLASIDRGCRLVEYWVRPDSQNQGIGRALLDEVEVRARLLGCCKMTLEVHDTNEGAKRLYRKFGFGPWDLPTLFVSKPLC
jgi:ribosomal protein S18 acetylase RimI-like enzyme